MAKEIFDTARTWLASIFQEMFRAMHNYEQDNFDSYRYPEAHRNAFFYDIHAGYLSFLVENADSFHAARRLLVDHVSRHLFDSLVLFRLLGHSHVKLPLENRELLHHRNIPAQWKVDETGDVGMFGPLSIFSVPYKGQEIWVKCWQSSVAAMFLSGQYHFARDEVRIGPEQGNYVIDGGGCLGDTALAFAADVGSSGFVYTFDPLPKHCEIMREACMMNSALASRIGIFDVGLSDVDSPGISSSVAPLTINPGARLEEGLPTRMIDSLVECDAIEKVDLIKLDVEGSELVALRGGERSIKRWRPKLAISLYHRPEDFFAIPLWLDSLGCGYHLFLDHYSLHHEETVLYATATTV